MANSKDIIEPNLQIQIVQVNILELLLLMFGRTRMWLLVKDYLSVALKFKN